MKTAKMMILAALMTVVAFGAKAQKWGPTPDDSIRNLTNYSLYTESYNQKMYADAYTPWKELITALPGRNKNDYIKGATILKNLANQAKTTEEREKYLTELLALYDQRTVNFGEKATNLARKALDLETFKKKAALKEYYGYYSEAVQSDLEKHELEASYVYKYFLATVDYVNAGYADSSLVVENYEIASDLLMEELTEEVEKEQAGTKNRADDYRKYVQNVEAAFSPYASCDQLVKIYSKKFEANPNDADLLKKITSIMMKKKCTEDELFFKATENLYAIEPTPTTAMRMGQMCISKKQFSKAVDYLNEAVKGVADKDKFNCYMLLGAANTGAYSWSAARTAYNNAAKIDPTSGEPYLMIANAYAQGAGAVPDNMSGRSAYWAAYDKCVKAKSIDPSCAERANQMMSMYARNFPKKDKAFELDLIDGKGYVVPGWIGESTIIRTH